jgi:hypothetical protein
MTKIKTPVRARLRLPIISVDAEKSFSKYEYLLTDNRRSFTFDNIKYALIVQCNDYDF